MTANANPPKTEEVKPNQSIKKGEIYFYNKYSHNIGHSEVNERLKNSEEGSLIPGGANLAAETVNHNEEELLTRAVQNLI